MYNEIKNRLYRIFDEILKEEICEIEKKEDSSDGNVYVINCKFNNYGEDESLKKEEVPLIKKCAIQWLNYLLEENKISKSLIDSFNTKIKLINENL